MGYVIDFASLRPYAGQFVAGLGITLLFSFCAIALSFSIGLVWVALRVSKNHLLSGAARGYIEFVRNVPLLVWLYFAYFGLGSLGLHLSGFEAGLAAFAIYGVAYTSEIYRAGIMSVPKGQWEAALALGLRRFALWRRILLPQALRAAFHPLGNLVIASVLASSLVMVLSVQDLTFVADQAGVDTFRYFEAFVTVAVLYLIASQVIQALWRLLGARLFPSYAR